MTRSRRLTIALLADAVICLGLVGETWYFGSPPTLAIGFAVSVAMVYLTYINLRTREGRNADSGPPKQGD
jgi:hypothetical protein